MTEGFTCGKWFIGYNFGIDDDAESKFDTNKELIVLNIFKYKYCVLKIVSIDQLVAGLKKKSSDSIFLIHIKYF